MKELEKESTKEMFKKIHYIFEKQYDLNSEESIKRYRIFKNNYKAIKEHNKKNLGWTLGIGPFYDLTNEEFKKEVLTTIHEKEQGSYIYDNSGSKTAFNANSESNQIDIYLGQDWSKLFPFIKNQNSLKCGGTCYAYATVSALEGRYNLKYGEYKEFSTYELVFCSDVKNTCNGGRQEVAYEYVLANGLSLEADYPSTTPIWNVFFKLKCNKKQIKPFVKIKHIVNCNRIGGLNCSDELIHGMKNGPVSVLIDMTLYQHYEKGIVSRPCSKVNHSVTAVQVTKYYIKFLNSWGSMWGDGGYGMHQKGKPIGSKHFDLDSCGMENVITYGVDIFK